jgi:hypothetical protein
MNTAMKYGVMVLFALAAYYVYKRFVAGKVG